MRKNVCNLAIWRVHSHKSNNQEQIMQLVHQEVCLPSGFFAAQVDVTDKFIVTFFQPPSKPGRVELFPSGTLQVRSAAADFSLVYTCNDRTIYFFSPLGSNLYFLQTIPKSDGLTIKCVNKS